MITPQYGTISDDRRVQHELYVEKIVKSPLDQFQNLFNQYVLSETKKFWKTNLDIDPKKVLTGKTPAQYTVSIFFNMLPYNFEYKNLKDKIDLLIENNIFTLDEFTETYLQNHFKEHPNSFKLASYLFEQYAKKYPDPLKQKIHFIPKMSFNALKSIIGYLNQSIQNNTNYKYELLFQKSLAKWMITLGQNQKSSTFGHYDWDKAMNLIEKYHFDPTMTLQGEMFLPLFMKQSNHANAGLFIFEKLNQEQKLLVLEPVTHLVKKIKSDHSHYPLRCALSIEDFFANFDHEFEKLIPLKEKKDLNLNLNHLEQKLNPKNIL